MPLKLLDFQTPVVDDLVKCLTYYHDNPANNRGRLIVQPAGTGKTYEYSEALARAIASGHLIPLTDLAYCSTLIATVAKAKTQTERVLASAGVADAIVTSHAGLAKGFGDGLLTWASKLRGNEIVYSPTWDSHTRPRVLIIDESQAVKNEATQLAEITKSFIQQGGLVLCVSATPFTRASETTITNLALRLIADESENQRFMDQFRVSGASYTDYSPGTMRAYNDYLVSRGLKLEPGEIKFPHRCFNKCVLVDFETPAHREIYNAAYEDYLKELAEAGRMPSADARVRVWVANQKFWQKSELIRCGQLVKVGKTILDSTGKQIIIAVNYKDSFEQIYRILTEIHKVPESKISRIVGGRNCQPDIDKFQYGKTDWCLLTLKAGGAGLSLHHEHKQARPRYCIIPPTYSAIQLVQLLGRAHRITSLSTTYQDCVWFRDTIEEEIAEKVQIKMKSLKEVVSRRETWLDMFVRKSKEDLKEITDMLNKDILTDLGGTEEEGNMFINSLALEALE